MIRGGGARPLRSLLFLAAFLGGTALPGVARATFSIVAADTGTGEIGSAGASCVPYEVIRILRVADGRGLLVGQAYFDDDALATGQSMLAAGEAPASVLAAVTDAAAFPDAPKMQYGIVDVEARTASITGPEAMPYAGDLAGASGTVAFTVQGNLLTGPEVLEHMSAAAAEGCDLPERLVRALEAAGTDGGGDSRCTDGGISAASAYVLVQRDGVSTLRISLPDLRPEDPVAALRGELDEWRAQHPCPLPEPRAQAGEPDGDPLASPGCAQSPAAPAAPGALLLLAVLGAMSPLRARRPRRSHPRTSPDRPPRRSRRSSARRDLHPQESQLARVDEHAGRSDDHRADPADVLGAEIGDGEARPLGLAAHDRLGERGERAQEPDQPRGRGARRGRVGRGRGRRHRASTSAAWPSSRSHGAITKRHSCAPAATHRTSRACTSRPKLSLHQPAE